jgi:aspartyl-tRNA(Asn)/glutamyl-tRNA(Gln) amidotransferase subunit C
LPTLFLREMQRIFSNSSMSLTRQDVEKIAHLARLSITDQEMPAYVSSLSSIVNFVDELSKAQTGGVEPMAHPLEGQHQRLRADAVSETDHHEKYQANAPSVTAGLYVVPRVIE